MPVNELPTAAEPRVSIVVVVSTAETPVRRCLESLAGAGSTVSFETVVVLNGLPPAAASSLRHDLAGPQFVESPVNLGFAGAVNLGRATASGEFIVSLHDDAEAQPGWLDALVEAADGSPGAGAVGSLVLGTDRRVQAAGFEVLPDGSTRPPWDGEPPPADTFTERRAVDQSPACSLLVRASTWDRMGGADERFFPLYYVDVDLCVAIRARGERVILEPRSVVLHHRGASTDRDFAAFLVRRNKALMLEKWGDLIRSHVPGSGATLSLPAAALPPQHADPDLFSRARHASAVAGAYEADLRSRLEELGAVLEERTALLERLAAELETTRGTLLDRERDDQLALRESHTAAEPADVTWLRERSELLALIEQGGWWRLRARVLPVLRMAAAARSLAAAVRRKR